MEKIFNFKSSRKYYDKEFQDIKNNTVREIHLDDERFLDLIAWMKTGWKEGEIKIRIEDALYPEDSFEREIQDITIWEDLMIITWKISPCTS